MTRLHSIAPALLLALVPPAYATDVTVVGLFPNKAVVQINGGTARTLSIRQKTAEGGGLVSVDRKGATFDIDAKRRTLNLGQHHCTGNASSSPSVTR